MDNSLQLVQCLFGMGCLFGLCLKLVADFLCAAVKVTCSLWATTSKHLLLDSIHRTMKLHHRCCTKSCSSVRSKFGEARLRTQNPELENQLLLLLSWSTMSLKLLCPSRCCYTSPVSCLFKVYSYWMIESIRCSNRTKFNTAPRALNNTHSKCEANNINSVEVSVWQTDISGVIGYMQMLKFTNLIGTFFPRSKRLMNQVELHER